ncbi:excalibur calcium-binding domain-containing protein [Streptomyces lavendulae]|uniref:excalibur calcium-binding domain-containing protein n=1 Tax=Streptomyces lavendulae TaxID=1914 RepID=UPI0022772DDA|nr:excalibur calcium-binding domain-containing protein [Streptomyces lavendulae]
MSHPFVSEQAAPAGRRLHPVLAVPLVVAATAALPPLGAVLASWVRWGKPARAVTVTLACVWFIVLVSVGQGSPKPRDDAKPVVQPAATVTATATATATVMVTLTPTPVAPTPAPAAPASASTPPMPSPPAPERPAAPRQAAPPLPKPDRNAGTGNRAGDNVDDGEGTGGGVSYRNCSEVRAAGAAPIHRGDPGYGRHLDRDGDGTACE